MTTGSRLAFAKDLEGWYYFRVIQYELSLSAMKLQISRGERENNQEGIVLLDNVQYFAGWFNGYGIIKNGTSSDCLAILRQTTKYIVVPDDYLLEQFALLEILNEGIPILKVVLQNARFFM